jgi:RNA polymerase sigma factor (sigma-70 family)
VLQSLFVRLMRQELPAEFEHHPRAYLYRATVNLSLNLIRSRRRTVSAETAGDCETPALWQESRAAGATREKLRDALAELHPKAAEILILRHVHGYTDKEIAAFLGTSRGTIAVSLVRSRAKLRRTIRAYLLGEES